jgi:DNA (cytosine-5)-methyltransferase 1
MTLNTVSSADLFCGAGGFSAGLIRAAGDLGRTADLLAVNHWPKAIATHKLNHPSVDHLCENLDNVDPRKVIKSGRLEILLASPECTHHSNARGGKPMSDQSRASAWHVLRWAEALRVENIIVENVKEFLTWGPLNAKGRPMESKRGELFRKFCECLEVLGYRVDWRVINSAHYGAATSRERLFIQATRRRRPIWPEKSHYDPKKERGLFDGATPYRAAREVIDWSLEGQSIFGRKKPLSENTLRRIMAGLKKFGGGAFGVCEPFIVPVTHGGGEGRVYDLTKPLPTVTAANRGEMALIEPFIVPFRGENATQSPRCHSIDEPLPTVCTANGHALVKPYFVKFYGTSDAAPCDAPLPTVTATDRFGLCEPEPVAVFERDGEHYALMDIRFRMLQPHELASAMGMDGYQFTGTKTDSTRMIGNAVEVNTARALCRAVLQ